MKIDTLNPLVHSLYNFFHFSFSFLMAGGLSTLLILLSLLLTSSSIYFCSLSI
jgi:hypothetical protein